MCGSPNFEPLTWVLAVEMAGIGLAHVSKMIAPADPEDRRSCLYPSQQIPYSPGRFCDRLRHDTEDRFCTGMRKTGCMRTRVLWIS